MIRMPEHAIVAVVGAGAMGAGIAQVAAQAGHFVWLYDLDATAGARGRAGIATALSRIVTRGKLAQKEADEILQRIHSSASLADLADADLVIEAIVERLDVKQALFRDIETVVRAKTILTTNTSSLSVSAIAQGLKAPQRFAGLHFFNPAPVMQLVEVVAGLETDPAVIETLCDTAKAWGKHPVRCRSTPGFIVNRVARPFYAEALRLYEEGVADFSVIDHVLRKAGHFRMGPFELMDLIGHDVNFAVTASVFAAYFHDPRFRPSLVQQELVAAGWLGRKSGRGFYHYEGSVERADPLTIPLGRVPAEVVIEGDLGPAEPLIVRLKKAGIRIVHKAGEGVIRSGRITIALTDGRTASERASVLGRRDVLLFDYACDFETTPVLAVAQSDHAMPDSAHQVAAIFASAGIECIAVDDAPGLIVMRTVCMLANEASEVILHGIATRADIDLAMCKGVNYPVGPCTWAEAIGLSRVICVLDAIHAETGDDRYRASSHLRRIARAEQRLTALGVSECSAS